MIPVGTVIRVPVKLRTLVPILDRDYLFEPSYLGAYIYVVDANISFVYVINKIGDPKVIL